MMILQMTGATVTYALVTVVAKIIWNKREKTTALKIAVGLFFGLCSVFSNHAGVDYGALILNVRDIGPMAAGLFFDPLSGILAGLIGSVERFIIGEFFNIGSFTRVACSLSTCLAGFVAAGLHRWAYKGERPPATHAFFLGAVIEVFHMYVVMITHRDDMVSAFYVVRLGSAPMIIFTAIGLTLCTLLVRIVDGEPRIRFRLRFGSEVSLDTRIQVWFLAAFIMIFLVNYYLTQSVQKKMIDQEANNELKMIITQNRNAGEKIGNLEEYATVLNNRTSNYTYLVFLADENGKVIASDYNGEPYTLTPREYAILRENAGKPPFMAELDYMGGFRMLCITDTVLGDNLLTAMVLMEELYADATYQMQIYEETFSDILLFSVLFVLVTLLFQSLVNDQLSSVVGSLRRITSGDLDETVNVRGSLEFDELSDDINRTVTALKGYIDAAEKRMEQELKLASAIQESALPRVFTFNRTDLEIYALMDPARQVGGDFYDFFFIDIDRMAMVVADVSGKGIPAALFMMRSKTAIKNMARTGHSPAKLLQRVNEILCEGNDAEMFVTVWIGIINLRDGVMQCANAGHEYPVLMREGEKDELLTDKHGLVLGAMEDVRFREYEIRMNPGDRLFVYTDGVPEAINEAEEQYGTARLVEKLNEVRTLPEEKVLRFIRDDIAGFTGKAEQFDDITMLGFTYIGKNGEQPAETQEMPAD